MKFSLVVLLLAALAARTLAEREIIDVSGQEGTNGGDKDFEKSDIYSPNYCFTKGYECKGKDVAEPMFEVSPRACKVTCNRNLECASAFYSEDHICHHRRKRCTKQQLIRAKGGIQLYRLEKGESCSRDKGELFQTAKAYGRKFCRLTGKRCPHKGLDKGSLYKRPLNLRPWLNCLIKCAKIRSCVGVDFFTEDKKACDVRKAMCADEDLVDDYADNYVRLEEGVDSCGDGREEVEVPDCETDE